ncbi:DUF488 family protein [Agrobacterium salinitolerans]|uniref:DUF488 family protein n=1 Tax=Agrobacterium salinitolerans TaxID=1183413 RepID=A0ABY3BHG8_9HYPH|nr:DUF488 family protein [Agrobacterium salinitolerans]SOC89977.1 Protein of unknown function, DUF488 [Ensifer adhaerens]
MEVDTNTFFTIGHSTMTIAEFVDLLRESRVDFVVDVRTMPRSRTNRRQSNTVVTAGCELPCSKQRSGKISNQPRFQHRPKS